MEQRDGWRYTAFVTTTPVDQLDARRAGLVGRARGVRSGALPPSGAVTILRETRRMLTTEPTASAQQVLHSCTAVDQATALATRALAAFSTSHGLAVPDIAAQQRAAARRQLYLDTIPARL